eukprot:CAMPEP_0178666614 /NCGR_PEP_ID=MMETSP0698-20121128/30588_1 /TAXON_ID=265572 /ORGANISM="Extubocellulus spinifer, Strain CCMP396" /LENGTH=73 /DNA_ID=CAMNT_0020310021 /DNA_START=23 /DNA_END=241 /DNA_ORIENTATION=+
MPTSHRPHDLGPPPPPPPPPLPPAPVVMAEFMVEPMPEVPRGMALPLFQSPPAPPPPGTKMNLLSKCRKTLLT